MAHIKYYLTIVQTKLRLRVFASDINSFFCLCLSHLFQPTSAKKYQARRQREMSPPQNQMQRLLLQVELIPRGTKRKPVIRRLSQQKHHYLTC